MTLIELVVSLGLVSVLVVTLVAANIFVEKVLGAWSARSRLYEEREFIINALAEEITRCDSLTVDSSQMLAVFYLPRDSSVWKVKDDVLYRDGTRLTAPGIEISGMEISKLSVAGASRSLILPEGTKAAECLYTIELRLSFKGQSNVVQKITRNSNTFFKDQRFSAGHE